MRSEFVPLTMIVSTIVAFTLILLLTVTSARATDRASGMQNAGPKAPTTEPAHSTTADARERESKPALAPSGPVTAPEKGTLLLCSLNSPEIRAEFLKLAGGPEAKIVMIVKQIPGGIDPADAGPRAAKAWGVRAVTFWKLTDRRSVEDKVVLAAQGNATGVWLPGGKPPEYLDLLLDSAAHHELTELLARGGVIGGESAGAVIQSSFVALPSGSPHTDSALEGLGFARNLVIFPHFSGASGKFPREACEGVIAVHVGLAGLALPDGSAVVVRGRDVRVLGEGEVSLFWRSADGSVSTTRHEGTSSFTLPERAPTTAEARPK